MDHITLPINSPRPPCVPYLGTARFSYDTTQGSDFVGYPARVGVDMSRICDSQSLGEHAAFLQQWLFFGTLKHILGQTAGVTVDIEDFVRTGTHGDRFITTGKLFKYMWYWTAGEVAFRKADALNFASQPDQETASRRWRRDMTVKCLKLVCEVTNRLTTIEVEPLDAEEGDYAEQKREDAAGEEKEFLEFGGHMILLSITILGELMYLWADEVYDGFGYKREDLPWKFSGLARERLRSAGWCLGELEMLGARKPGLQWYLSFFDRTDLGKDHSGCCADVCNANQIDEMTYRTRHVAGNCHCKYVDAMEQAGNDPVSDIIKLGGIPVITCEDMGHGGTKGSRINASKTYDERPYVAISHVWSDGLGNPRVNSLPGCQLQRLQTLVNSLYEPRVWPVPFWIDTICVPLDSETRIRAIRDMARTYKDAHKVLVLDSSLQKVSTKTPDAELLIRISCTTWNQRLWTYQEGILATQLFFQLYDGAVRSEDIRTPFDFGNESKTLFERAVKHFGKVDFTQSRPTHPLEINIHRALVTEVLPVYEGQKDMPTEAYENAFAVVGAFPGCPDVFDEALLFRLEQTLEDYIFMDYSGFTGPAYQIASLRAVDTVAFVALALNGRLTSKQEDEAICASVILGKDPTTIIKNKTVEGRMKAFWSLFETVPRDIIFGDIPRLKDKGYAWAPASFMVRGAQLGMGKILHGGMWGQLHGTEGLKVSGLFSYIFPTQHRPTFYDHGDCFYFTSITPAGSRVYVRVNLCRKWNNFDEEEFCASFGRFGLILGGDKSQHHMPGALVTSVTGDETTGSVSGNFCLNTMVEQIGTNPPYGGMALVEGVQQPTDVQWFLR